MLSLLLFAHTLAAGPAPSVLIRKTDGAWIEGTTATRTIAFGSSKLPLAQVLSLHTAGPATASEKERIGLGLAAIQSSDRAQRDLAVEDLTQLGLPVLTPLLEAYKDTDQHEPKPLYNLFERILPPAADSFERGAGLARLKGGLLRRGDPSGSIVVDGQTIPFSDIRLLAVRQRAVERRNVYVHSIRHCTQIEYFDSGIAVTATSNLDISAQGFTRLSWNQDSWATDPNGLTKPGSPAYKTNLWDGQPFGALVARIGAAGEVFFAGKQLKRAAPKAGRLQLAINDNRHWQNNLGGYTVTIRVTEAYDLGAAQ